MAKKAQTEAQETPQYYLVLHTGVGRARQNDVVTADQLGKNAEEQVERLIRKGAIARVDPPAFVTGEPNLRSAISNSTGIVDQHGLDRPDIATRSDVQITSPEEREELLAQEEAENPEEVEEEATEPAEGEETAPAATRKRGRR